MSTTNTKKQAKSESVNDNKASVYSPISQNKLIKTRDGKYRIPKAIDKTELYKIVLELVEQDYASRVSLTSAQSAKDYLQMKLIHQDYESFYTIYLNAQHQVLGIEEMFKGTINQTPVFPGEIVKQCVIQGAAAVIHVHNHPSGSGENNCSPSQADKQITTVICDALKLIEVRCLDHFIIGGANIYSFAEYGLL